MALYKQRKRKVVYLLFTVNALLWLYYPMPQLLLPKKQKVITFNLKAIFRWFWMHASVFVFIPLPIFYMWWVGGNCWIIITVNTATVSCSSWMKWWLVLGNKQFNSPIPSCCVSPKAVTYDSFTDWTSREEQREVSGRDLSKQELMKGQAEHSYNRITHPASRIIFIYTPSCALEQTKAN